MAASDQVAATDVQWRDPLLLPVMRYPLAVPHDPIGAPLGPYASDIIMTFMKQSMKDPLAIGTKPPTHQRLPYIDRQDLLASLLTCLQHMATKNKPINVLLPLCHGMAGSGQTRLLHHLLTTFMTTGSRVYPILVPFECWLDRAGRTLNAARSFNCLEGLVLIYLR